LDQLAACLERRPPSIVMRIAVALVAHAAPSPVGYHAGQRAPQPWGVWQHWLALPASI
jgi:hypothetical protein